MKDKKAIHIKYQTSWAAPDHQTVISEVTEQHINQESVYPIDNILQGLSIYFVLDIPIPALAMNK